MKIDEFIKQYKNHPILFVGTGLSLRYLKNSYNWNGLLHFIAMQLKKDEEYYLDLKSKSYENGKYNYEKIASFLEKDFNKELENDRNGEFKNVNDLFYELMKKEKNVSRFKIYISKILSNMEIKEDKKEEIELFRKIRKNIGSIITTNYDEFIEKTFDFTPLIGNNILLSNPYGAVYKIHGCISNIENIIISEEDYKKFDKEYELIRAQLLSLFIHNPIIFLGYSIEDNNIKNILKTIFSYINPDSEIAQKIKRNFLLIEYDMGSKNDTVTDYDINMDSTIIRINKLKTDDFALLFQNISDLNLPISAMDIKKVQNIVKEIYAGGNIKVSITEDLDELKNSDKVLAIGTNKTIRYVYQKSTEYITNYFKIMEEGNSQILSIIDEFEIQNGQYFPIYGYSTINNNIKTSQHLKKIQLTNLTTSLSNMPKQIQVNHKTIADIELDETISPSNKINAIIYATMNNLLDLNEVKSYLISIPDKKPSNIRKLLCAYDLKKYAE